MTELTSTPSDAFLSTLFLVPKKDGGQRPVINLKNLNSFVEVPHFKMEGIHTLKGLLKKGDWLVKINLKDAYFSICIDPSHRKFLCVLVEDKLLQFNCLPFGLASAPWVFTKTLRPVIALGQELGMWLVVYIDDILLMAEIKEKAQEQVSSLIYLQNCLGFTKNRENSHRADTNAGVSRFYCELSNNGADPTIQKNKKNLGVVPEVVGGRASINLRSFETSGQNERHKSSNTTSSTVLYRSPDGSEAALRASDQDYETLLTLSSDSKAELSWWDSQMGRRFCLQSQT